jgi:hypothetical protein
VGEATEGATAPPAEEGVLAEYGLAIRTVLTNAGTDPLEPAGITL